MINIIGKIYRMKRIVWIVCAMAALCGAKAQERNEAETARTIKEARKAIKADAENYGAYIALGEALMERGEWKAIVEEVSPAIDVEPGNFRAYLLVAGASEELERYEDAVAIMRSAIGKCKEKDTGYEVITRIEKRRGETRKAIDDAIRGTIAGSEYCMETLAGFAMDAGMEEEYRYYAKARLMRMKADAGKEAMWRFYLALAQEADGEIAEALGNYLEADAMEGKVAYKRGAMRCWREAGEYKKALAICSGMFDGNDYSVFMDIASIHARQRDYKSVIDDLGIAIERSEGARTEARRRRSEYYLRTGEKEKAMADADSCAAKDGKCSANLCALKGRIFEAMGKGEKAKEEYKKAVECEDGYDASVTKVMAHIGLGETSTAEEMIGKYFEKRKNATEEYAYAQMMAMLGKAEEAVEALREALKGYRSEFCGFESDGCFAKVRETEGFKATMEWYYKGLEEKQERIRAKIEVLKVK